MSPHARLSGWLSNTPLRRQLQLAALTTALLVGTLGVGALVSGEYRSARRALLRDLQVQGQMIAANSSAAAAFRDALVATEILGAMRSSPDIVEARLVLRDSSVLARYSARSLEAPSPWSERVALSAPVSYRGQQYGVLALTGDYSRVNRRLLQFVAGAAGALLLAVLVLGTLFGRALTVLMRPVSELTALMRKVSADANYSLRSGISARNEWGEIAYSFNRMLEQIESRDTALEHELEERRRTEKRLDYLAHHDSLTGLGNRNAFMQLMATADSAVAGAAPRLCLQLLDVDHFKLVNDSLGHHAGDQLLIEVAARLRTLQDANTHVFRIGGDEFAVALSGHSGLETAQQLAQRIVGAMSTPFRILGQELFTSLSIGVALCPDHARSMETLLNCADLALYQAKSLGRDRWALFSPDLKAGIDERIRLEADLRRALERDELFLVYEPQVNLAGRSLAGMEALVRWRHPELGVLEPARFIPMAEETGLIIRMGEWVLRRACQEGAALLAGRAPLRLSVNLSPRQLADPAIVDIVARAIAQGGIPAHSLELEVTESVMIEKLDLISRRMEAIAATGVTFAMDDFGVGASSLSYLRRLPLSKIKIDRCFVRELPHNEDDAAVAAAITALGRRLGIPVLAEGVETAEQLACLHEMGCDMAQGYLFSRPQPLPAFLQFLDAFERAHASAAQAGTT